MQISNSMQSINNTLVYETKRAEEEQQQKEIEKQYSQKTNGYNTTSKLYFELSEDVSQYSTANPTQDRIDEDVLNTLSKHEDGSFKDFFKFNSYMKVAFVAQSEEGRELALNISEQGMKLSKIMENSDKANKALQNKYGRELYSEVVTLTGFEFSKDEFEDKINRLYDRYGEDTIDNAINDIEAFRTKYNNQFASLKPDNPLENITLTGEHFAHYNRANEEDMAILAEKEKERFQNTYRLSDEFAKTEKFDELFTEYKEEGRRLAEKASERGEYSSWNYIFNGNMLEVEKAMIIGKGYSKSEWIESIDKSKTLLEDMIKDNPDMMTKVKVDMEDNIKFYENILTDLKELWQYGDFKADG